MHVIDHTAYVTYVCQKERSIEQQAKIIGLTEELRQDSPLTTREMEILDLIVQEFSSKQIAAQLYISNHTVISHRKNMMDKLRVKSVVGLVRWWCEHSIINII